MIIIYRDDKAPSGKLSWAINDNREFSLSFEKCIFKAIRAKSWTSSRACNTLIILVII